MNKELTSAREWALSKALFGFHSKRECYDHIANIPKSSSMDDSPMWTKIKGGDNDHKMLENFGRRLMSNVGVGDDLYVLGQGIEATSIDVNFSLFGATTEAGVIRYTFPLLVGTDSTHYIGVRYSDNAMLIARKNGTGWETLHTNASFLVGTKVRMLFENGELTISYEGYTETWAMEGTSTFLGSDYSQVDEGGQGMEFDNLSIVTYTEVI